jgi:photosystem II stability/assembly factor-like uncharacterized protein
MGRLARRLWQASLALFLLPPAVRTGTAQSSYRPVDTLAFAALKWRNIGPYRSGRSVAVAGSVARPYEYYSGTTGGGVMKTTNGGYTWEPVTDKYFGGTVGGIGIYQPNPDIAYVGTGEFTLRGNTSYGDGVYKTTDAGATWSFLGLKETRHISAVLVHPWNPDLVYVAALGHAYGPNPERGVFRSKDGGKTWDKILFRNDSSGVTDLVMDPGNPAILYAATWQVVRRPWDIASGGPGSAIYKTTDGGDHWTELTRNPGLPKGLLGNVGLAVSPANPRILWAMIEADSGGLYRSGDAGATWQRINKKSNIHWRPFYFTRVFADPADTNTVYLPNGVLYRSTDGGKRFTEVRPYNDLWDSHYLWIAPDNRDRIIVAADQGARVTVDRGANWSTTGYPTGQFYHISTTNHFPYRVCGSQQDNSGSCGPSRSDNLFDITQWYYAGGGESGMIVSDPTRPDVTYATGGGNTRYDRATGRFEFLDPWWEPPALPKDARQRWNWTTPIAISPHDPRVLYLGSNRLWRSQDRGANWSLISPDLTRHDPKTLIVAGGPITKEVTGAETYATIFTIAESPVARGTIWTGSDDGVVQLSRDAGAHWNNVSPSFPEFTRVSSIEPSPHAAGTAYVAANRNMLDDYGPYLYRTTDFGRSWTKITEGIPAEEFTRIIREDPVRKGLLYAGTERGVWVSFDDGAHWQSLRLNLPPVPVHDLVVKEADLAIATHGRAFWILDDISPLRQLGAETLAGPAHLFAPRDAWRIYWGAGALIENLKAGANPPSGAFIYYWLKDKNQEVTLDILDAGGTVVNSLTSRPDSIALADSLRLEEKKRIRNDSLKTAGITDSVRLAAPYVEPPTDEEVNKLGPLPRAPNKQGLNLFTWNFRYADGVAVSDTTFSLQRINGATAVPGAYAVRLTVGGKSQVQRFALKADPRVSAGPADFRARLGLSQRISAAMSEVVSAINGMAALRTQAADRRTKAGTNAALAGTLSRFSDSLSAWSRRLATPRSVGFDFDPYSTSSFSELQRFTYGDMNAAPNQAERTGSAEALARARQTLADVKRAIAAALPAVNDALRAAGLAPLAAGAGLGG